MNNPLVSAYLAGCIITAGLLGSYLIQRKRFELSVWLSATLLAISIGAILTIFLCSGPPVFSTVVALGFAVIIYLSPQAKQNENIERLLASTTGGIIIGMESMVGFVMCC